MYIKGIVRQVGYLLALEFITAFTRARHLPLSWDSLIGVFALRSILILSFTPSSYKLFLHQNRVCSFIVPLNSHVPRLCHVDSITRMVLGEM